VVTEIAFVKLHDGVNLAPGIAIRVLQMSCRDIRETFADELGPFSPLLNFIISLS